MLKILVSDRNLQENKNCCEYLANDKSLDVISTNSGIATLNKYYETQPDILVINSNFEDMDYTEIINKLSTTSHERKNCNIIITLENSNEKIIFNFVAKLYKLMYLPLNYKEIKMTIEYYKIDNNICDEPTNDNLTALFYKLNLYNELVGSKYLKYAIQKCYEKPELKSSLINLFNLISKEFEVSTESVRPAMRNALKSVNKYKDDIGNKGILKLFENEDYITPKNFIRIITDYYLMQQKKK